MKVPIPTAMKSRIFGIWTMPAIFGFMVVALGGGLIAIFVRSPYTHANLASGYSSSYTRTEQIVVGPPVPYVPPGLNSSAQAATGQVRAGELLMVGLNCASCHGLQGQGSGFAPPIAGANAQTLAAITQSGPGGMPVFAGLTQQQLTDLAAFLQYVTKAPQGTGAK